MKVLESYIQSLQIGRLSTYQDLTLCFLTRSETANLVVLNYCEGLITGGLEVEEIRGGGDVNTLKFTNVSLFSIFVPQGVILLGLKQNRATAQSFLIKPREELIVPVLCVEEGRWTSETKVGRISPYQLYPRLKASNIRHRTTNNQSEIWEDIRKQQEKRHVKSNNGFVGDVYDAHKATIEDYIKNLPCPEHSTGFIAIFKGKYLLCLESFANHRLLQKNYGGLLSGIVLETTDNDFYEELKGKETITVEEVLRGIASVSINKQQCKSLGDSHDFPLENEHLHLIGSLTVSNDTVLHLEVFHHE